jgi:hypothetical protein
LTQEFRAFPACQSDRDFAFSDLFRLDLKITLKAASIYPGVKPLQMKNIVTSHEGAAAVSKKIRWIIT